MTLLLLITLALVPAWVYAGYPVCLWLLNRTRRREPAAIGADDQSWPAVTLLITARNEELEIEGRLANAFASDYPRDRLSVVVASDGSTDRTEALVSSWSDQGVRLARGPGKGKSSAQNAALRGDVGEIVVFTDANSHFLPDTLRKLLAPFADPAVGCTVGQVTYLNGDRSHVGGNEGLYWRYELFLRRQESDLGILAVGSGPIMAARREFLYEIDPQHSEDFAIPLRVLAAGRRTVYVPDAVSREILYQDSVGSMYRSRVRIVSKDLRTLLGEGRRLSLTRQAPAVWGLVSHKLLRWNLGFVLLGLLAVSALAAHHGTLGRVLFQLQAGVYVLAASGAVLDRGFKAVPGAASAFYFCLIHAAAAHGVLLTLSGRAGGQWNPVRTERPENADGATR